MNQANYHMPKTNYLCNHFPLDLTFSFFQSILLISCTVLYRSFYFYPLDAKVDYTLTDEYRKKHFLSGLLLQELKSALREIQAVRRVAITTLRNQLAKHAWDDRYQKQDAQQRKVRICIICTTY